MKIPASQARAAAARPDGRFVGWLLFGPEPAETDDLRLALTKALLASGSGDSELTRIQGDALRRDPAALADALGATSLFGGAPVVLVEGAGEGAAPALDAALASPPDGPGKVVVTAGDLKPASKLRKLFEGARHLAALGIYGDPPDRAELERMAASAGIGPIAPDAMETLTGIADGLQRPEIRNLLELLSLYRIGVDAPVTAEDVRACAPTAEGGELEPVVQAVSARRPGEALEALARAYSRGRTPVAAAMQLGRWFRLVHAAATHPGGPGAAIDRMRPPLRGPRRTALERTASGWSGAATETALAMILDCERGLRGIGAPGPDRAVVERLVVRLATLR